MNFYVFNSHVFYHKINGPRIPDYSTTWSSFFLYHSFSVVLYGTFPCKRREKFESMISMISSCSQEIISFQRVWNFYVVAPQNKNPKNVQFQHHKVCPKSKGMKVMLGKGLLKLWGRNAHGPGWLRLKLVKAQPI